MMGSLAHRTLIVPLAQPSLLAGVPLPHSPDIGHCHDHAVNRTSHVLPRVVSRMIPPALGNRTAMPLSHRQRRPLELVQGRPELLDDAGDEKQFGIFAG